MFGDLISEVRNHSLVNAVCHQPTTAPPQTGATAAAPPQLLRTAGRCTGAQQVVAQQGEKENDFRFGNGRTLYPIHFFKFWSISQLG